MGTGKCCDEVGPTDNDIIEQDEADDDESSRRRQKLETEQKLLSVFSEWIDLLFWSLPPSWRVHTILNDIRTNVNIRTVTKYELKQILRNHRDSIFDSTPSNDNSYEFHSTSSSTTTTTTTTGDWSQSCQSNINQQGWNKIESVKQIQQNRRSFACGFWNLLHIISIGVTERHKAVLGDRERVSPSHIVKTIRNYVNYFLGVGGDCDAKCRNFLLILFDDNDYDTHKGSKTTQRSSRHSTTRFKDGDPTNNNAWKNVAIWLWKVHNAINVKILEEQIKMMEHDANTRERGEFNELIEQEKASVMWPTYELCPKCYRRQPTLSNTNNKPRNDDGIQNDNWDISEVYLFLKSQYW